MRMAYFVNYNDLFDYLSNNEIISYSYISEGTMSISVNVLTNNIYELKCYDTFESCNKDDLIFTVCKNFNSIGIYDMVKVDKINYFEEMLSKIKRNKSIDSILSQF